jgi:hypothetical protein
MIFVMSAPGRLWHAGPRRCTRAADCDDRVTSEALRTQLRMSGPLQSPETPYRRAILTDDIPLSSGCGRGQSKGLPVAAEASKPGQNQCIRTAEAVAGKLGGAEYTAAGLNPALAAGACGKPAGGVAVVCGKLHNGEDIVVARSGALTSRADKD